MRRIHVVTDSSIVCILIYTAANNGTKPADQFKVLDSRKAYNICKETMQLMLQLYTYVYIAFGLNTLCSVASIAILLGHLRVSYDDVKKAILSCDTQLLSIERLQQMEKYAPDKKEVIKRIVTVIFYI